MPEVGEREEDVPSDSGDEGASALGQDPDRLCYFIQRDGNSQPICYGGIRCYDGFLIDSGDEEQDVTRLCDGVVADILRLWDSEVRTDGWRRDLHRANLPGHGARTWSATCNHNGVYSTNQRGCREGDRHNIGHAT